MSKPALASVGLFYAVSHWNDFFNSLIYLNSTEKFPVQIILRQIVLLAQGASADGSAVDFGVGGTPPEQVVKMAATVVATIPILCVYPFVQKYFEQGCYGWSSKRLINRIQTTLFRRLSIMKKEQ